MNVGAGTRALVTGASRGIGRALAERLAARGATVGLLARSESELEALADVLPGDHVVLGGVDVGDRASVEGAVARFAERAGGIDLVVSNAGLTHYELVREQSVDHMEEMTRVNWLGTVYTVKSALPTLLRQGSGHVVVVSSGAGHRSFPQAAVYGATKAAQRMFGEALRHELAGTGVSLTMVYPGEIATSLHDHEKERMPSWYKGGPNAAPARSMADKIITGIEEDARSVYHPPIVRLLGAVHGLSPAAGDRMLRILRGPSAAPRR
ncbi:MAG: Short-chain dehydrogenase/reductase SDR [uncultured Solirubrobacteraceae bacterium]|uniref:Short-chain dehydrogenase/reductase SDR n=1 Tax=uncultured Solirubrobacteraceae bacterium TaxID=1162706 RepID=A0A6J4S864_9ACTN|nr:MAG: Short-chain dehydrogenase/reductase SDR [uncultured Solirubrobacteraceae bacterium]